MINVDDRLIREELAKIGVDAFAVLMCIASHLGKGSTAWPGVKRLRELTALSKERTYNAIKKLIAAGMVERWQENENGTWGRVVYRVTTSYLSIYAAASSFALTENPLSVIPEHGYTEHGKPEPGNTAHLSINKKEVLISNEVINKREEEAPAQNETNEDAALTEEEVLQLKEKFIVECNGLQIWPKPEQPQTPPPDSAPPPSPQVGARNAPSVEDMAEYLEDLFLQSKWQPRFRQNPPETAEEIHDYYTANGWKVGRNPMKDWKAACRNWLKNNRNYGPRQQPQKPKRVVSEETHRRALAITLAELGVTGS